MSAVAAIPAPPPALVEIKDGTMRLNLHRGQQRAWLSEKRFVCVVAGSQSGKTAFGPHWLRREMEIKGPGDYMVVTPTFPLLEIKALPEFRRLFEDQLQLGTYKASPPRRFEVSDAGAMRLWGYVPTEPTTVWFGYAADPDSLESATVKGLWMDECGQQKFKLASWEALQRRLALHQARSLMTTTPYNLGWLYTEIWKPWKAADENHSEIDVINFESIANPAFSKAEYDRLKRELPGWKFDLFHRGVFTRPAGLIYDNFNEDDIIEPFVIPDHWPRYLGNDFGGVNTAALFVAEELDDRNQPNGNLIYYREYLAGNLSTAEHASAMMLGEPRNPDGSTVLRGFGGAPSEDQWRREFTRAGLPIYRPPIADVEIGIDRVYATHGKRQIKVFRTLTRYLEMKRTYQREVGDDGEPTEKIEDKEKFHLLDCERYVIPQLRRTSGRRVGVH